MTRLVTQENYQQYLDYEEFTVLQGNILKKTDSYNLSHQELKVDTDWEVSHIYNRRRGMILYGFNKLVRELTRVIIKEEMVHSLAAHAYRNGIPLSDTLYDLWLRVANELDGRLPLKIEALPDGTWCPKGTPFAQIRNTIEGFGELVTWFEPILLKMAFPSGCATRAFFMRRYLDKKQAEQGAPDLFKWRFHNFGYRGNNSEEDSFWSGTAWNLGLYGTDNFNTSWFNQGNIQGSIRALAHKVTQQYNAMTASDAREVFGIDKALPGDVVAMYQSIDKTASDPDVTRRVVALVIDTYDAMKVINNHVVDLAHYGKLKGVHVVFRPDSGDVLEQGIMMYWKLKNAGLEDAAHCIIGEGMSFEQAQKYDERLEQEGIPLIWFFYGIGGGFFKDIDRDWVGAAMKTAYSNGADRMKMVLTAPEKSSIPGKVQLISMGGILTIVPEDVAIENNWKSEYHVIYDFSGGKMSFEEVQDWGHILNTVQEQTAEQGRIAMSREILEKIENFKKQLTEEIT